VLEQLCAARTKIALSFFTRGDVNVAVAFE